jgi:heat shock protein HspQ
MAGFGAAAADEPPARRKASPISGQSPAERHPRTLTGRFDPWLKPASAPDRRQGARIMRQAKFGIGQVVRHRIFEFRGVVFDVDPVFSNTEEWWLAIPEEIRPSKDQPYYHLLAENADSEYIAYVSEQNLLPDESEEPLRHPQINEFFDDRDGRVYIARDRGLN